MAGSLNKAMIIGNVTRDPELRATPSGQSVCTFGVATNRVWKDKTTGERKEDAEFHNIVAWGRLADTCSQYLHKGSKVYVEGYLKTRSWDDQQSGVKKYRTEIVAGSMTMLDRPTGATGGKPAAAPAKVGTPPEAETPPPTPAPTEPAEEEINIEDIPF